VSDLVLAVDIAFQLAELKGSLDPPKVPADILAIAHRSAASETELGCGAISCRPDLELLEEMIRSCDERT
jgi:hypothetical protein